MSDVSLLPEISGLSFDSTLLTTLLFFLHTPVALSVLSFCCLQAHTLDFFQKKSSVCLFVSFTDRLSDVAFVLHWHLPLCVSFLSVYYFVIKIFNLVHIDKSDGRMHNTSMS